MELQEKMVGKKLWKIRRFANAQDHANGVEYSKDQAMSLFGAEQFSQIEGNLLLNEGINTLWTIICSAGGTKFDATNAYLGVGDDNTAESAAQTGLLGSNKYYQGMDGGYPTFGTLQKATWRATFASGNANFAWNEFTVANDDSNGGINLNRKVSAQGTKISGQVWELTLEITLS